MSEREQRGEERENGEEADDERSLYGFVLSLKKKKKLTDVSIDGLIKSKGLFTFLILHLSLGGPP